MSCITENANSKTIGFTAELYLKVFSFRFDSQETMQSFRSSLAELCELSDLPQVDYEYWIQQKPDGVWFRKGPSVLGPYAMEDAKIGLLKDLALTVPTVCREFLFISCSYCTEDSSISLGSKSSDLVALNTDGQMFLFYRPQEELSIKTLQCEPPEEGNLSPAFAVELVFRNNRTPLREIRNWLSVVTNFVQRTRIQELEPLRRYRIDGDSQPSTR